MDEAPDGVFVRVAEVMKRLAHRLAKLGRHVLAAESPPVSCSIRLRTSGSRASGSTRCDPPRPRSSRAVHVLGVSRQPLPHPPPQGIADGVSELASAMSDARAVDSMFPALSMNIRNFKDLSWAVERFSPTPACGFIVMRPSGLSKRTLRPRYLSTVSRVPARRHARESSSCAPPIRALEVREFALGIGRGQREVHLALGQLVAAEQVPGSPSPADRSSAGSG